LDKTRHHKRYRQTGRQADTDRQIDRLIDGLIDRQTDRGRDRKRQTERERQRGIERLVPHDTTNGSTEEHGHPIESEEMTQKDRQTGSDTRPDQTAILIDISD
jgi:hypothetical protein